MMILKSTPKIEYNDAQNKIRFEGIFIIKSYWGDEKSILEKMTAFIKERDKLLIEFAIFYLDSVSRKIFFELFVDLKSEFENIKSLTINWYYDEEDESILELGEVLKKVMNIPINFIKND
jgi:hypothetical protein